MLKKLTVNTGQVMISGEICYYLPPIQLTKSLVNIVFRCIIYCCTNAVAVMYSRSMPMAETRIENNDVGFFSNNYYIYLKRYFEKVVTNKF